MAEMNVTLQDGLTYGKDNPQTHYHLVLREPTGADVIDAQEAAERAVFVPQVGYQLMVSQTRLNYEILRRQIKRIGDDIEGPLNMAELRRLSTADLELLDTKAEQLDAAGARAAAEGAEYRGRDQPAPGDD